MTGYAAPGGALDIAAGGTTNMPHLWCFGALPRP